MRRAGVIGLISSGIGKEDEAAFVRGLSLFDRDCHCPTYSAVSHVSREWDLERIWYWSRPVSSYMDAILALLRRMGPSKLYDYAVTSIDECVAWNSNDRISDYG